MKNQQNNLNGRDYPLEYFPGEILTETAAKQNRNMLYYCFLRLLETLGLTAGVSPTVVLSPPTTSVSRCHCYNQNSISGKVDNNLKIAPVVSETTGKITYTKTEIFKFEQKAFNKLKNSDYNVNQVIA